MKSVYSVNVAHLLQWNNIIFKKTEDMDTLSHLGTLHSNEELEMAVREWLRIKTPISTAL
jgi:hypothetical protein